jgi:hypothetical protein
MADPLAPEETRIRNSFVVASTLRQLEQAAPADPRAMGAMEGRRRS